MSQARRGIPSPLGVGLCEAPCKGPTPPRHDRRSPISRSSYSLVCTIVLSPPGRGVRAVRPHPFTLSLSGLVRCAVPIREARPASEQTRSDSATYLPLSVRLSADPNMTDLPMNITTPHGSWDDLHVHARKKVTPAYRNVTIPATAETHVLSVCREPGIPAKEGGVKAKEVHRGGSR